MKLSVIVPAFNEERTVESVLRNLISKEFIHETVFVDDGSTDRTCEIAYEVRDSLNRKKKKLKVLSLPENRGKGRAFRKGIAEAGGDVVGIFDADLEYDPADLKNMFEVIKGGDADVVYGSRFMLSRPRRVHSLWHYAANRALTVFTNILFNVHLTDMETALKMFKKEVLELMDLKSEGFDIEPEITAKTIKKKWRIYEVPISYHGRGYKEGKKIKWYHGFQALWALIKYRFVD